MTTVRAPRLYYMIPQPGSETRGYIPYPPDTKAFLYYVTPPDKPRIAGELRFRVASSDNPASFESGSDLLMLNGQPWWRPLYVVSKYYPPLYEKLREERFIPDDLDAVLSTFPPKFPCYQQRHHLYTLNDTFTIDFSNYAQDLSVITEQGIETLKFCRQFSEKRPARIIPYTGAYANHHLLILLKLKILFIECRKCLGSI